MKQYINKGLLPFILILFATVIAAGSGVRASEYTSELLQKSDDVQISWTHLSTANGDLDVPSGSTEQTASLVLDINKDGLNDLVVAARKGSGPSMVWYKKQTSGWQRFVIDNQVLSIEAGGAYHDIDQDGDLDIVMGGDSGSSSVWWW